MGTYKITISPDGSKVDIDADGFSDSQCLEKAKEVLKALGGSQKTEKKPEAYCCTDQGTGLDLEV